MRIPNIYKTFNSFEGHPGPESTVQPIVQFFNCEDIVIEGYLEFEGTPVIEEDWNITAIVKAGTFNHTPLWEGSPNNGVYTKASQPGFYKILVPSSALAGQPAGTFWLDILLKEQIGRFNDVRDRTVLAARIPFGYDVSAATVDIVVPRVSGEHSYPPSVNITKL